MKRVLVISPHPDDETIGCGGTLRRHVLEGNPVHVLFLTSGEQGGHGRAPKETAALREKEARAAAKILGLTRIQFWREPDGAFAANAKNVKRLVAKFRAYRPDLVLIPHDQEQHADHRSAVDMLKQALAVLPDALHPEEILMFEIWTPLQSMDWIEDISLFMDTKLEAIRAYKTQCDVLSFDDAFLGLARYRGEMHSWPGGDYAEVFRRLVP